jgi:ABC-2 type transport system ATP-binding protein
MMQIKDLYVSYGNLKVLQGIDLQIQKMQLHGLVGLNGSGKTTLLNTIYGIKKQDTGEISTDIGQPRRKSISFLETENYFFPRITGHEYLQLVTWQNKLFNILDWNEIFELPLEKLIDTYSTGMKKKLALFGVIGLDRPIMILDEPFNGIDIETVQKLKSLLSKLKNFGKMLLVTSHILESLTGICDCISFLNEGKIQFTAQKSEFNSIEERIFALHKNKIDEQLSSLLKGS